MTDYRFSTDARRLRVSVASVDSSTREVTPAIQRDSFLMTGGRVGYRLRMADESGTTLGAIEYAHDAASGRIDYHSFVAANLSVARALDGLVHAYHPQTKVAGATPRLGVQAALGPEAGALFDQHSAPPEHRTAAVMRSLDDVAAAGYNTDGWKKWQQGDCDVYAASMIKHHPHLQLGVLGRTENGGGDASGGWMETHYFAHDKTHAYDSAGKHPLPYLGIHEGDNDYYELGHEPETFGLPTGDENDRMRDEFREAHGHAEQHGILSGRYQKRSSGRTATVLTDWRPTQRLFAPTKGEVDPRLFDNTDRRMWPLVRSAILEATNQFFTSHGYGANPPWARVYLAGSQASEWFGNRDFDTLIGIDYDAFRAARPQDSDLSVEEIDRRFNDQLRADYNDPQWHPYFDPDESWDRTGYVNHDSWDIAQIKPYAAYDVTNDRWAVNPIDEPQGHTFRDSEWYYFEGIAEQARRALALPEPARTQRCSQIWEFVHSDRSRAFGPHGTGAFDRGNALEKYLSQAPVDPHQQGSVSDENSIMGALADVRFGRAGKTGVAASDYGMSIGDWPANERSTNLVTAARESSPADLAFYDRQNSLSRAVKPRRFADQSEAVESGKDMLRRAGHPRADDLILLKGNVGHSSAMHHDGAPAIMLNHDHMHEHALAHEVAHLMVQHHRGVDETGDDSHGEDFERQFHSLLDEPSAHAWREGKEHKTAGVNGGSPGSYYHGTRYELHPGQVLEGGHVKANQGYGQPADHVYFSGRHDVASYFAEAANGPRGHQDAPPRVYKVEPIGDHEQDPDEDEEFESHRARKVRVLHEVPYSYPHHLASKTAGASGDLPEGITFRHVPAEVSRSGYTNHEIHAHVPSESGGTREVGRMILDAAPEFLHARDGKEGIKPDADRYVAYVSVDHGYTRRGVASAMWEHAKGLGLNPIHSDVQSGAGHAWAESIDPERSIRTMQHRSKVEPTALLGFGEFTKQAAARVPVGQYPDEGTAGMDQHSIEDIPVSSLRTDQNRLDPRIVQHYLDQPSDEPIIVNRHGDEHWVVDGNHRGSASVVRGDATIRAKVWHRAGSKQAAADSSLWPLHPTFRPGDRVMIHGSQGAPARPATVHSIQPGESAGEHPWINVVEDQDEDERRYQEQRGRSPRPPLPIGVHQTRVSLHPTESTDEQRAYHQAQTARNEAGEPYVPEAERNMDESDRVTVHHLTADPHFKPDPHFRPQNNTTMGGDLSPRLFVGDPRRWAEGEYGYKRPYVAEMSVPRAAIRNQGGYSGEQEIHARHFDKVHVTRVVPYDVIEREEYGSHGPTESFHGTTLEGKPISAQERQNNEQGRRNFPQGYRWQGDTRDWSPQQHREHLVRHNQYLRGAHGWDIEDDHDWGIQHEAVLRAQATKAAGEPTTKHASEATVEDDPTRWGTGGWRDREMSRSTLRETHRAGEYTYHHAPGSLNNDDEGYGTVYVTHGADPHNVIGESYYGPHGTHRGRLEMAPRVAPEHRRKGVATGMYDFVERLTGKQTAPADTHSDQAEAFWQNRATKTASEDYRLQHHAPGPEGTAIHEMPDDLMSHPEYYGSSRPGPVSHYHCTIEHQSDQRSYENARGALDQISRVQGKPDAHVDIYRAVPKHVDSIHSGDWVTLHPGYAQQHGESSLDNDYKILKASVPAKHVNWDWGGLDEYGYNGPHISHAQEHTDRQPTLPWHEEDES